MDIRHRDRQTRPGRSDRWLGAAVTAALLATACGGGSDDAGEGQSRGTDPLDDPRWEQVVSGPAPSDAEPRQGGSIVVALESETNSYDPAAFLGSQAGWNVAGAIYDPLVTRDSEGNYRPYLAESIEPDDDFTRWTLRLRPGVRFHDGTPLDAAALERMWDDHIVGGRVLQGITVAVDRLEVVDDLTVAYVLRSPNAQFPELLESPLGWPFSPDAAERLGDDFGEQPVGTGPFRFVRWQRDAELVVERNPDYWQQGQPYLDQVTFRPIPDEATRVAALAGGDVDALQSVQLSGLVAEVADVPGVEVVLGRGANGGCVLFNTTRPPLDDVRLRQSLAYAVDQEALVEVAAGEAAELTELRTQFYPSDSPFHSEAVAEATPSHDPERARELYQDYVDDPDRSDGKPPGEPVILTLDVTNVAALIELATAYEGFYEEAGFDVTVRPLEQSISLSTTVARDYDAKISRYGINRSPLNQFGAFFGDPDQVTTNFTGFHDDTVAEAVSALTTADSVAEQAAITEELGLHLAEQVPMQWTASDLAFIAARDDVHGLRSWTFPDGTLGDGVLPGATYWGQVWLDE